MICLSWTNTPQMRSITLRRCKRQRGSSLRSYSRGWLALFSPEKIMLICGRILCRPRVLELTAADELVALENMAVVQQNGFEVGLEMDQPAGRRLRLLAQPVSKNTEFDVQGKDRQFIFPPPVK